VNRKFIWTAAIILATVVCSDKSHAEPILLLCETKTTQGGNESREMWEITDTAAFVNGTKISSSVSINSSMIEVKQELDFGAIGFKFFSTIRIDRSTGQYTDANYSISEKYGYKDNGITRVGACSKAPPA
jgi:hypothetical protein